MPTILDRPLSLLTLGDIFRALFFGGLTIALFLWAFGVAFGGKATEEEELQALLPGIRDRVGREWRMKELRQSVAALSPDSEQTPSREEQRAVDLGRKLGRLFGRGK